MVKHPSSALKQRLHGFPDLVGVCTTSHSPRLLATRSSSDAEYLSTV